MEFLNFRFLCFCSWFGTCTWGLFKKTCCCNLSALLLTLLEDGVGVELSCYCVSVLNSLQLVAFLRAWNTVQPIQTSRQHVQHAFPNMFNNFIFWKIVSREERLTVIYADSVILCTPYMHVWDTAGLHRATSRTGLDLFAAAFFLSLRCWHAWSVIWGSAGAKSQDLEPSGAWESKHRANICLRCRGDV